MSSWVLSNESVIRVGVFLAVFCLMAIWELLAARRELAVQKGRRWIANLGLVVLDTVILRLLFPAAAVGMALTAEEFGWGLLHKFKLPYWPAIVLSIVILDFTIYLQHVMFHAIPALWRLHIVHHADVDFDVTTGIRFHPIEIVLSMLIKLAVVAVVGPPSWLCYSSKYCSTPWPCSITATFASLPVSSARCAGSLSPQTCIEFTIP
jgi:sterol desaturase/sphingolipid hydroxylase (fatty acid hydroxylase superfamily)